MDAESRSCERTQDETHMSANRDSSPNLMMGVFGPLHKRMSTSWRQWQRVPLNSANDANNNHMYVSN